MSHHQVNSLQEKLARQDAEIQDLKDKLVTYNVDMAIKNELNKQFMELDEWVQEAANNLKHTDAKQSNIINDLFEKIKKSELVENVLRVDNDRLTGDNRSLTERLKTLQCNEQKYRAEADTMEMSIKSLKNELRDANNRSHELSSKRFQCERHELLGVREQLEECRTAVGLMKDAYGKLETELEVRRAAESRLEKRCRDLEAAAGNARAKLKHAESRASVEREDRARERHEAMTELDAVRQRGATELDAANGLVTELQAQRELDRQVALRDLEDAAARLEETERSAEETKRSAETRDRANDEARERLQSERDALESERDALESERDALLSERDAVTGERDAALGERDALSCELRQKAIALADLERQVRALSDEIERAAGDRIIGGGGGGGGGSGPSAAGGEMNRRALSPPDACADNCDTGDAVNDEELVNKLKDLYRDLAMLQNESKMRQRSDQSLI